MVPSWSVKLHLFTLLIFYQINSEINHKNSHFYLTGILGGLALAQVIPPTATHFSIAWSVVCLLSVIFMCTLLKLFDGFRCHLAGTLVGSNVNCVKWNPWTPGKGRGGFGDQTTSQSMQLQIAAASWRIKMRSDSAFYQIALVLVHHRLNGSSSHVLTATSHSMGKPKIRPPQNRNP